MAARMQDSSSPEEPAEPLFRFVRRLVLVVGLIVGAAWFVTVALWFGLRLIDW
jgi:hypothetical protein